MSNYIRYADLGDGKPVQLLSAEGVLMFCAIAAYENGSRNGKIIVERALAVAVQKGYAEAVEFVAAFTKRPIDRAERIRRVEAVFAVIDAWECAPCALFGSCKVK